MQHVYNIHGNCVYQKVTVQAEYWNRDYSQNKSRNPPNPIDAADEMLEFYDDSITNNYIITLVLFENGIENTAFDDVSIPIEQKEGSPCKLISYRK